MTDEMYFGLPLVALVAIAAWTLFRKPNRHHRIDHVAAHKRKLTRNAFKSRIGRPYREYV